MSTITTIQSSDLISDSRSTINTNFSNLNTDKVEGQSSSIDSEVALFSGTGGKTIKRASATGIAKLTSGVLSAASQGTDYYAPGGTDVAVSDGGTGVSSLTSYAVLCGGTTSTGAIQPIASVGSSGQALVSNGAGALPTFQTISGGVYQLVSYTSGTGTSVTVSSLDLATDLQYKVIVELEGTASGANAQSWRLRINGITTSTYKYLTRSTYWAGGAASSTQEGSAGASSIAINPALYRGYYGELDFFLMKQDGTNNRVMTNFNFYCSDDPGASSDDMRIVNGMGWQTSQANLTSITFAQSSTTGTPTCAYKIWILKPRTS